MVNMKDEDYFNSLPRKELQDLCRNNGLPANKTKPQLANLLASCYQKKNTRSAASEERPNSLKDGWTLVTPILNSKPRLELNSVGGIITGASDLRVETADMDNRRSSTCSKLIEGSTLDNDIEEICRSSNFEILETGGCLLHASQSDDVSPKLRNKDTQESVEARECDQNLMGLDRHTGSRNTRGIPSRIMNMCDIPTTIADTNLHPSFEFYVSSEQGINLVIDLNSRPSDWIKKLNDGVCIHPEVLNSKSRALRHELKSLKGGDEEVKASPVDTEVIHIGNKGDPILVRSSSIPTVRDSSCVQADQPDRSSRSIAITRTNTPEITLEVVNDSEKTSSSLTEPNFDIHNPTNMTTRFSPQSSEKVNQSSEVLLSSQFISVDKFVTSAKSDGPKSFASRDHQSKSGSAHSKNRKTGSIETSSVPHARRLPLSYEVLETVKPFSGTHGNGSAPLHGFSISGDSVKMHLSEVAYHSEDMSKFPYQNDEEPIPGALMDCLQNDIGNSANSELDLNRSLDPLSEYPEELQRSNLTNETECSECSQFDTKSKIYKRSNSSDSEGLPNKRLHRHAEDSNNPAVRNAKELDTEVLPRRSMRLVSK